LRKLTLLLILYLPTIARAEILTDLTSPATTPAVIPMAIGASASIALLLLEDQISDPIQQRLFNGSGLNRTLSKAGDLGGQFITNGAYTLGMLVAGWAGNERGRENAELMALASAYSVGLSTLLKVTALEPRPYDGSVKNSFPSGHTTAAFAFASVVGAQHGWAWGIPAYALAVLTATERMADNKHYLHDVVAGATIGLTYGLGMHYLHGAKPRKLSLTPFLRDGVKGAMLSLRF
jgi:hypothetical protein